jgi:MFS family permease
MTWGALMSFVGLSGTLFSHDFYTACFFRFITGCAATVPFYGCMKTALSWFPANQAAFAISTSVSIGISGFILAQYPFQFVVDRYGYDAGVLIVVLYTMAVVAVTVCGLRDADSGARNSSNQARIVIWDELFNIRHVLANPRTWNATLFSASMNIPVAVIGAGWTTAYLTRKYGMTADQIPLLTAVFFSGLLAGGPIMGRIFDRIEDKGSMMMGAALFSILIVISAFLMKGTSVLILGTIFAVFGMTISAQSIGYAVLSDLYDLKSMGKVYGVAGTIIMLWLAIAQNLCGWASDGLSHIGMSAGDVFPFLFISFALLFSAFCAFGVRKQQRQLAERRESK